MMKKSDSDTTSLPGAANWPRLAHIDDYPRYGRQMILDNFGLQGQIKLQRASVAVIGAGGLGCPALQYLAAAGVGRIAIIDHDTVELSNIQRQVLHNEGTIGMPKALSAAAAIGGLNSTIRVEPISEAINSSNAISLLHPYDIILDCTDNIPTSGAAQKYEGQLCIYNLGDSGPCYRCIFPRPPAPEMTGSCEEMGILGAVTGIIGVMQALETIKILVGLHDGKSFLMLFSAMSIPPFRTVKLRARKPTCPACGVEGPRLGAIHTTDYITFCGGVRPDWQARGLVPGSPGDRISAQDLRTRLELQEECLLLDVRPKTEFGICHLPGSLNVPLSQLLADPAAHLLPNISSQIVVLCRLGNDSQIAADALREYDPSLIVKDVIGGLCAWAKNVDPQFPTY